MTSELTTRLQMTNEAINGFGGANFPELRKQWEKEAELLSAQISIINLRKSDWIYQSIYK